MKQNILKFLSKTKNNNGAAILMALFTVMLMSVIALELSYDTSVNYIIGSRKVNQLKIKYANKSAEKLGLFRIYAYYFLIQKVPSLANSHYSSLIWSFPLSWPVDPNQETLFDTKIKTKISSESGKLNINLLAFPIPQAQKENLKANLFEIFLDQSEKDKTLIEKYSDEYIWDLIGQITDWSDADQEGSSGESESEPYQDEERYPPELFPSDSLPPNRFFSSKTELLLLPNMTPELYRLYSPHLTIYGDLLLNLYYVDKKLLRRFFSKISEEELTNLWLRLTNAFNSDRITNKEQLEEAFLELGMDSERVSELLDGIQISPKTNSFLISSESKYGKANSRLETLTFNFKALSREMLVNLEKTYYEKKENSSSNANIHPPELPKLPALTWPLDVVYSREN